MIRFLTSLVETRRHFLAVAAAFFLVIGAALLYLAAESPFGRFYASRNAIEIVEDVPYVAGSKNPKHRLDLYLPKRLKGFPVIIFIHGGFWRGGDRKYYQELSGTYANLGAAFAKRGIGVVIPSYRLHPEVTIGPQFEDVTAALSWTEDNIASHGGDPERIFLMGHSAGGHLASMLAMRRAAGLRGVISLSGIYDLAGLAANGEEVFNRTVLFPHFGADAAALSLWSPADAAHPDLPPFALFVGERDFPYLEPQAAAFAERLRKTGVDVLYEVVPDYTHAHMVLLFYGPDDALSAAIARLVSDN